MILYDLYEGKARDWGYGILHLSHPCVLRLEIGRIDYLDRREITALFSFSLSNISTPAVLKTLKMK